MKKKMLFSLGLLSALLVSTLSVSATTIEMGGGTTVKSDDSTSGSLSGETGVEVHTSREASSGQSTGREDSTGKATGLPVQASATATLNARIEDEGFEPIEMDRKGLQFGTTSAQTISASSVSIKSESELRTLAQEELASDSNIKRINIEASSTEVDYEYQGRFLGIFPVKPTLKASIDSEGKVKIKFPWYEIFVRRTTIIDEASVAADVSAQASVLTNQTALNAQARSFIVLSHILKTRHDSVKNSINNVR